MPEYKKPERYVPGPGMPELPPQLRDVNTSSVDEFVKSMNKMPFFMTELTDEEQDEESNSLLEALKAVSYEGEPHEVALNFKNQGNDCYRSKDYRNAIKYYTQALDVNQHTHDDITVACLINRAQCNLELRNYRRCITDCKQALKLDAKNVKAVYRSARAYKQLDKVDEAIELLEYGLSMDPNNAAIKPLLKESVDRRQKLQELEKARQSQLEIKQEKQNKLQMAIEAHSMTLISTNKHENGESQFSIKLLDELDPSSPVLLTILVLYPLVMESDMVQDQNVSSTVKDMIQMVLDSDPKPQWFVKDSAYAQDYALPSIETYCQTMTGGLAKIGSSSTIEKIASMKSPVIPIIDNCMRLYVIPRSKRQQFLSSWNKQHAISELNLE